MPIMLMMAAAVVQLAPSGAVASPPAQAQAAISGEAARLAALMAPREVLIDGEMRQFDLHFRNSLLNGKSIEEADGDYPGLTDAIVTAARPLVAKAADRSLTEMHAKVARLIQGKLTPAEITELQKFYTSGVGSTIVRGMIESADAGDIYKQAVEDPDAPVTDRQISAQIRSAATKATGNLSDADRLALLEFMKQPVFPKLAGMQVAIRQIAVEAHNRSDPELEAEMDEVFAEAMAVHMRKLDAKKAK